MAVRGPAGSGRPNTLQRGAGTGTESGRGRETDFAAAAEEGGRQVKTPIGMRASAAGHCTTALLLREPARQPCSHQ